MADYYTLLTTVGAAKLAAAQASGAPLVLETLAIGDSNGTPYAPTVDRTELVNELSRVSLEGVDVDPLSPTQFRVRALVPASVGGFTVREIGLFDADDDLIALGRYPNFYKPAPSEGFASDLLLTMIVAYSSTPLVTVVVDSSQVFATREWVRAHQDFVAVLSATTPAPPSSPTADARYLIPAGASGAWSGRGGQIAIWNGILGAWQFAIAAEGVHVHAVDTDLTQRSVAGVWTPVGDSPASVLYLHANCL